MQKPRDRGCCLQLEIALCLVLTLVFFMLLVKDALRKPRIVRKPGSHRWSHKRWASATDPPANVLAANWQAAHLSPPTLQQRDPLVTHTHRR